MTTRTPNLNLKAYNTAVDSGSAMYDWMDDVSGSSTTQNLGIIDAFAGEVSASMTLFSGSISAITSKINTPKSAVIQIVSSSTDVDAGVGLWYMRCPSEINGMNISRAQAFLNTAGITGNYTIQVRNMTKYVGYDSLSTPVTIVSGATVGTAGSINTSYDDVSTDDQLKIYVTGVPTTLGKGLQFVIEFAYS